MKESIGLTLPARATGRERAWPGGGDRRGHRGRGAADGVLEDRKRTHLMHAGRRRELSG